MVTFYEVHQASMLSQSVLPSQAVTAVAWVFMPTNIQCGISTTVTLCNWTSMDVPSGDQTGQSLWVAVPSSPPPPHARAHHTLTTATVLSTHLQASHSAMNKKT